MTRGVKRPPFWCVDGAPVWYRPAGFGGTRFAAVVAGRPWRAHGSGWQVALRNVETACGSSRTVVAAPVRLLLPRPDSVPRELAEAAPLLPAEEGSA